MQDLSVATGEVLRCRGLKTWILRFKKATVIQATKMRKVFCNLPQNELKSHVARFTTHVQNCLATNQG